MAKDTPEEALGRAAARNDKAVDDFESFATTHLGITLEPWQREVLRAVSRKNKAKRGGKKPEFLRVWNPDGGVCAHASPRAPGLTVCGGTDNIGRCEDQSQDITCVACLDIIRHVRSHRKLKDL